MKCTQLDSVHRDPILFISKHMTSLFDFQSNKVINIFEGKKTKHLLRTDERATGGRCLQVCGVFKGASAILRYFPETENGL